MKYVKYFRTFHAPWSEGATDDDKVHQSMQQFYKKRVIVTEKFDGQNFSMYNDYCHARSIDGNNHPSMDWIKAFHSSIKNNIPEGFRICGENMYAKHTIFYDNLPSYFLGFSIWNNKNFCMPWDETIEWFELIGITPVKILYDGVYNEKVIKNLYDEQNMEGYVIRIANGFDYNDSNKFVAKFVRKNHVLSGKHWAKTKIIPNKIKNDNFKQ